MVTSVRAKWVVVALAFLAPLAFAAFTHHAWEDYFITLRSSRNLVDGHGLVFNPGERVHTFTSPLGVLVPAACTALAGPGREEAALWLFRLINAAALAGGAWLLWRRADTLGLGSVGRLTLFGLLIADAKLTDFSINGMETALLVFFLLWLWSELEAPAGPRPVALAGAFAGLMWTRPDAFVLAGVVVLAQLAFPSRPAGGLTRRPWMQLWHGALLSGALYAPWFFWAWHYYGTPVPHTIIAKSAVSPAFEPLRILQVPWRVLIGQATGGDLFLPAYASFGSWPKALGHLAHALTVIAMFAWLVPAAPAVARRASLALFAGAFYYESIILFPWYVPPWTVLAVIALAFLADAGARATKWPAVQSVVRIACLAVVITQAAAWGAVAWQMRMHQRYVETGVRRAIGEWLHAHASTGDRVFMEPLGYIGYFSQLKTYDFPGLSSPEVVAAIRASAPGFTPVIEILRPQWLVLRPFEVYNMNNSPQRALDRYEVVQTWSARAQLDAVRFLPGRRWCEWEAEYAVFRRRSDAPPPAARQ